MFDNPFDILLIVIYFGFLLSAFLAFYLMKLFNAHGLFMGIMINTIMHFNLIFNGERLATGHPPATTDLFRQLIFFVIINLIVVIITYYVARLKGYPKELLAAFGLAISSIFFVEFYVPALYILFMLALPFGKIELHDQT